MANVPSPTIGGGKVGASDIGVVQTRRQNVDFSPLSRGLASQADDGGLVEGLDAVAQVSSEFAKQQQATEEQTEFGALKLELRKRLFTIQNGDPVNSVEGYRSTKGQSAVDGAANTIAQIKQAEAEVNAKARFERNKGRLSTANGFSALDALQGHSTYVNDAREQANQLVQAETISEATNAVLGSVDPVVASTGNLIEIEDAARTLAISAGAVPGTEQGDQIIEQTITDQKTVAISTIVSGLIDQNRTQEATALFNAYKPSINPKAWGGLMIALNEAGVKKSGYDILDKVMKLPIQDRGQAVQVLTRGSPETRVFVTSQMRLAEARNKGITDEQDGEAIKAGNAVAVDPAQNLNDLPKKTKDVLRAQGHWARLTELEAKADAGLPFVVNDAVNTFLWGHRLAGTLGQVDLNEPQYAKAFPPTGPVTLEQWRETQATQATTATNRGRVTDASRADADRTTKMNSATQPLQDAWGLSKKGKEDERGYFFQAMSAEVRRILEADPNKTSFTDKEYNDIARGVLFRGEQKAKWLQPNMSLAEANARGYEFTPFEKENQDLIRTLARETGLGELRVATLAGRLAKGGQPPTPASIIALNTAINDSAAARATTKLQAEIAASDEADVAGAETPQDLAALAASNERARARASDKAALDKYYGSLEQETADQSGPPEGDPTEVAAKAIAQKAKVAQAAGEIKDQEAEVKALTEAVVAQQASAEELKSALDAAIAEQQEDTEAVVAQQASAEELKSALDAAIAEQQEDTEAALSLGASIPSGGQLDALVSAIEVEQAKLSSLLAAQEVEDAALDALIAQQERAVDEADRLDALVAAQEEEDAIAARILAQEIPVTIRPTKKKVDELGELGTEVVGVTGEGRSVIANPDGSVSSERTATAKLPNGRWINAPTIFEGKEVSEDEAVDMIESNDGVDPETGRPLPTFDTQQEAVAAARERSGNLSVVKFKDSASLWDVAYQGGKPGENVTDPKKQALFIKHVKQHMRTADPAITKVIFGTVKTAFDGDEKTTVSKLQTNVWWTALHESDGYKFTKQKGGGPARGIHQVEPETAISLLENSTLIGPKARALLLAEGLDVSAKVTKRMLGDALQRSVVVSTVFAAAKLLSGAKATGNLDRLR